MNRLKATSVTTAVRGLHTYKCPFCPGWHVGHSTGYQELRHRMGDV